MVVNTLFSFGRDGWFELRIYVELCTVGDLVILVIDRIKRFGQVTFHLGLGGTHESLQGLYSVFNHSVSCVHE